MVIYGKILWKMDYEISCQCFLKTRNQLALNSLKIGLSQIPELFDILGVKSSTQQRNASYF